MGTLIWNCNDPKNAPMYSTNARGLFRWSGMTAEQLKHAGLYKSLLNDCRREAYCAGWNRPEDHAEESNPFHPQFLDGDPYLVWIEAYYEGRAERSQNSFGDDDEEEEGLDEEE